MPNPISNYPLFFNLFCLFALFSASIPALAESSTPKEQFQKLSNKYTITYGNPNGPTHILEYFSFSCQRCMEFITQDFPVIEEKYINTGAISWTFHPDPADILTLKALVCLERLSSREKQDFLKTIAQTPIETSHIQMKTCLDQFGKPCILLDDLQFLEKTKAFKAAWDYVKQEKAPTDVPTIEINGTLQSAYPSMASIEKLLTHAEAI